jgi:hypothetical protein
MLTRRIWLQSTVAAAGGLLLGRRAAGSDDPQLIWHNAEDWGVEGRAWIDSPRLRYFDRFPAKAESTVPPAVWSLSRHSAGMAVRFRTNATSIWVDYTLLLSQLAMSHMPATGVSGVDLYAEDEHGALKWVEVTRPTEQHIRTKLADEIDPGLRTYMLYLPLYNGVESLQIGVTPDAMFEGLPPRDAMPIVFYGTSIMHGACASRPGMAIPAIIGRRLAKPTVNVGFSGNGRMDASVVELLMQVDAAAFCIDCLPNMGAQEVAERTEPLVRRLREARPNAPVVLVEDRVFTNAQFFAKRRQHHQANHEALRRAYDALIGSRIEKLHYLPADQLLGDDGEAAVDGSHPSDLGFERYASAYEKVLRMALG